jgi:SAM-dependent methyltransferase
LRASAGPTGAVPRWASALLSAHRALELAHAQRVAATLEVLRMAVPAASRAPLTDAIFARQRTYAPGGQRFAEALHDWEQSALEHPAWPRAGRVLVGGAGGGRELAALAARGYEVSAFEPSGLADDLARAAAAAPTPCDALRGDYADLVRALTRGDGPLRPFGAPARFDAVVLGWASLSHVLDPADRRALLGALRRAHPAAPVLLSVHRRHEGPSPPAAVRAVRRVARALGWPGASLPEPVAFTPFTGFIYRFTEAELGALAGEAGYAASVRMTPYAHALLVPDGAPPMAIG